MASQPKVHDPLLSVEEYLALDPEGRTELVRGEIVTLSPSNFVHGQIAGRIARPLSNFVTERKLGEVVIADAGFIISRNPDTVRAPDGAFVSRGRIAECSPGNGFFPGAPDLAIEVVSPSDRWIDVEDKVLEYLSAGTREVWVVDPKHQTIRINSATSAARLFQKDQTLTSELLAGFSLPLKDVFE